MQARCISMMRRRGVRHVSAIDKLMRRQRNVCAKERRSDRLYSTCHRRWKLIRSHVLSREPLCRSCRAMGMLNAASHVDHVNGRADRPEDYELDNLQPLCASCHSRKTISETIHRGRV